LDNANVGTQKIAGSCVIGDFLFFILIGGNAMVKINGEYLDVAGKTLSEYLATTDYNPQLIAVERNEYIVAKSQYDTTVLEDEDTIEVVSFVGGG
jgi:sulfur carrier protein